MNIIKLIFVFCSTASCLSAMQNTGRSLVIQHLIDKGAKRQRVTDLNQEPNADKNSPRLLLAVPPSLRLNILQYAIGEGKDLVSLSRVCKSLNTFINTTAYGLNNFLDQLKVDDKGKAFELTARVGPLAYIAKLLNNFDHKQKEQFRNKKALEALESVQKAEIQELLREVVKQGRLDMLQYLQSRGVSIFGDSEDDNYTPLQNAICANKFDVVKYLIENDPDFARSCLDKGENDDTLLHLVVKHGTADMLKFMLEFCRVAYLSVAFYDYIETKNALSDTILHEAVKKDDSSVVKLCMQYGVNPLIVNNNNETPLFNAVDKNNKNIAQMLIEYVHKNKPAELGNFINRKNIWEKTALMYAAENGHVELVTLLLRHGANARLTDSFNRSAFELALLNNHFGICDLLINVEPITERINCLNNYLRFAVSRGHAQAIRFLLEKYPVNVNQRDEKGRNLVQQLLCSYIVNKSNFNAYESILLLLNAGLSIHTQCKKKKNIFHYFAQSKNKKETAKYIELLNKYYPAGFDACDEDKKAPLYYAAEQLNIDLVTFLLSKKVDKNLKDKYGRTALLSALACHRAEKNNFIDLAKLLLSKQTINDKDCEGNTLLNYATRHQDIELVAYLLEQKASAKVSNNEGITPLHDAQLGEIVKLLLQAGARPFARDAAGSVPLLAIARTGDAESLEMLLSNADLVMTYINKKDKITGKTALHYACKREILHNYVSLLIQAGADVTARDNDGVTPLVDLIANCDLKSFEPLLKLLLDAGAQTQLPLIEGSSVLHNLIARTYSHAEDDKLITCFTILKKHGFSLDQLDHEGNNLLHAAAPTTRGQKFVKFLIDCGISVTQRNIFEQTPLHVQAQKTLSSCQEEEEGCGNCEWSDCLMLLIKAAPQLINFKDNQGRTPLHLAVEFGEHRTIQVLLDHGADPNIQDNKGRTALHCLALGDAEGYDDLIKDINLLLEYKADATILDNEGNTPEQKITAAIENANQDNEDTDLDLLEQARSLLQ